MLDEYQNVRCHNTKQDILARHQSVIEALKCYPGTKTKKIKPKMLARYGEIPIC